MARIVGYYVEGVEDGIECESRGSGDGVGEWSVIGYAWHGDRGIGRRRGRGRGK